MKYIGEKEIANVKEEGDLREIEYLNGKKETLSQIMFDEIISDEKCDLTTLRDKRVRPVVANVLKVMRDWGIKTGEVGYFSALLNQSLQANEDAAMRHLWAGVTSTIEMIDDVSLVDVDKVLKSIVEKPIPTPHGEDTPN